MLTGINNGVRPEKKHGGCIFSFLKRLNISKCYISLEEKTITTIKIGKMVTIFYISLLRY